MNQRILATAQVLSTLTATAGVTFALLRLGEVPWLSVDWRRLPHWLETTPPTEALLAGVRLAGLGCGAWILASTCVYLTAALCRAPAALRIASPLTLPFVRNLGARVVVGALAVSALGAAVPAAASTDRPTTTGQLDSYPAPLAFGDRTPLPTRARASLPDPRPLPFPAFNLVQAPEPLPGPDADPDPRRSVGPTSIPRGEMAAGEDYRVAAGDHMWNIARRLLTLSMPAPPATGQIASYWVDLVEANRETIRSGDPDLIYPGETLFLPGIREV